jgi:putative flippase GtrA
MKFNFVGGIGVGLQLLLIAWLSRAGMKYLAATAVAVELTVLHNFAWHERYTWRDRGCEASESFPGRLLRFHLSNGAVSLGGNLALMAFLAGRLHLPVLAANAIAIVACSLANFFLADRWVFSIDRKAHSPITLTMTRLRRWPSNSA